jgi:hypothetical protein
MPLPPSKLALLQHIVKNLHKEPWKKDGPVTQSQLQALRMLKGKIGPAGIAGIRLEAAEAVTAHRYRAGLGRELHEQLPL